MQKLLKMLVFKSRRFSKFGTTVREVSKWYTRLGTRVGGVRVTQRYMYPRLGTREREVSKWYTGLGTRVGGVRVTCESDGKG